MKIQFVKFSPSAIKSTKGSDEAAGFDLYSVDNYIIRQTATDIGFKVPRGNFGKIHPRSSFALCFTNVGVELLMLII